MTFVQIKCFLLIIMRASHKYRIWNNEGQSKTAEKLRVSPTALKKLEAVHLGVEGLITTLGVESVDFLALSMCMHFFCICH